mmetsp:Transcript_16750/g.28497  ORF Transcript_16750/g.28497 Transcript_16750/m.28497 type:complete len:227 (+) Transcript_16750:193-873(+)
MARSLGADWQLPRIVSAGRECGRDDAVVGREVERGEDHPLDVLLAARVVLRRLARREGSLGEEDEVLGVEVALLLHRLHLRRLLQLRLQEGPRVERGEVAGVGRLLAAPARRVAARLKVCGPLGHSELLRAVGRGVAVGVDAQEERSLRHRARQLVQRREHRPRGEAVGVAVEGREHQLLALHVVGGDHDQVAVGHGDGLVEGGHHLLRHVHDRLRLEARARQQHE